MQTHFNFKKNDQVLLNDKLCNSDYLKKICYFKKLTALGVGPIADYFLIKRLASCSSCSAEVMTDRERRRLANIKPALVQPPVIIKAVLNNN